MVAKPISEEKKARRMASRQMTKCACGSIAGLGQTACGRCREREVVSDTDLLDWLERRASVSFAFENAEISFEVPDSLEGGNSVREVIAAAMKGQA